MCTLVAPHQFAEVVKQAKEKQLRIRAKKVTEEKKAAFALQHAAKMRAKGRAKAAVAAAEAEADAGIRAPPGTKIEL